MHYFTSMVCVNFKSTVTYLTFEKIGLATSSHSCIKCFTLIYIHCLVSDVQFMDRTNLIVNQEYNNQL